MEFHPKARVIGLFLDFVAGYMALSSARLATLGGEGLEALIWQEKGIAGDNGWLIESKRRLSRRLIRHFQFRYCSKLGAFPRLFQSVWGAKKGIDGFHLDLCGTFEPNDKDFERIVPLIMRSRGRCFAVTVADQRRNTSIERFDKVVIEAERLLGEKSSRDFFEWLLAEQRELIPAGMGIHAEPVLGASREFGFAVSLLKSLVKARAYGLDHVERYVYASDKNGRPFRMRTYFFHFAKGKGSTRFLRPDDAVKLWKESVLKCVMAEGLQTIVVKSTPEREKEQQMPQQLASSKYRELEALAIAAGGECHKQFLALEVEAIFGQRIKSAITEALLNDPRNTEVPVPGSSTRVVTKGGKKTAVGLIGINEANFGGDKALATQLYLLWGKADGEEAYAEAEKEAVAVLGLTGRKYSKNRIRKVGAHLARTQGKFRPNFVKRVMACFANQLESQADYLRLLASAYSKIEGKTITAEELAEEAKTAM